MEHLHTFWITCVSNVYILKLVEDILLAFNELFNKNSLPYSGERLRVNRKFRGFLATCIRKSFLHEIWGVASFGGTSKQSTKVFFCEYRIFHQFTNISPSKVSRYTVASIALCCVTGTPHWKCLARLDLAGPKEDYRSFLKILVHFWQDSLTLMTGASLK